MFRKWIDEPRREEWEKDFDNNEVVSVRDWMATVMLMIIPLVNIVMLVWWALADKTITPANKVNWARGTLIVLAALLAGAGISFGLYLLGSYLHT